MLKKQAHKFFQWYCHPDYYEDIQGDLEELYLEALANNTARKAAWFYATLTVSERYQATALDG